MRTLLYRYLYNIVMCDGKICLKKNYLKIKNLRTDFGQKCVPLYSFYYTSVLYHYNQFESENKYNHVIYDPELI